MAMTKQSFKNDCMIFNTLNELVPQEHLVRKLDNCMDFTFIEDLVKDLYSEFGRPSIPPVVLFKVIFKNDEYHDCYICPNNGILSYSTTDKNGYKQYKSNLDKCVNCPLRKQCTNSKSYQKEVTRHIWEEYKEQANENRYTQNWKDNYPKRKETIERVFGDCKEQHNLRFTRIRGLLKNEQNTTMIFACHNLKKMTNWRWKMSPDKVLILQSISNFLKTIKKKHILCRIYHFVNNLNH